MLPNQTRVDRFLSKRRLYDHFKSELTPKRKESFDQDIAKIYIANELNENNTGIARGEKVNRIFVIAITLKQEEFDHRNIVLLARYIQQNILFKLIYKDHTRLAIVKDKLYISNFYPRGKEPIPLKGLNLDTVWDNMVLAITGYRLEADNSLAKQLEIEAQREKLKREMKRLDKKGRKEKQPGKKFDYHRQVQAIKKQLKEL